MVYEVVQGVMRVRYRPELEEELIGLKVVKLAVGWLSEGCEIVVDLLDMLDVLSIHYAQEKVIVLAIQGKFTVTC